uniref:DDE-1 domain-containing protein n=1 Tax=Strongyloides venezuelensis TaxID=75913 RepID=A0A0K0FPY8_STRVS
MDEVPLSFNMPWRYTVNKKKIQDVSLRTTGNDKCGFTVLDQCWKRRPHASTNSSQCLLILDFATSHFTNMSKKVIQQHTKIAVIPAGMTKLLHPLDFSVNKSFKANLKNHWDD